MKKKLTACALAMTVACGISVYAQDINIVSTNISYDTEATTPKKHSDEEVIWKNAKRIGDSTYKWSMDKSSGFTISYRSLDEAQIELVKDGATLSVSSEPLPRGYSHYEDLKTLRTQYKGCEITEQITDNSFTFCAVGDNEAIAIRRIWSDTELITAKCYSETESESFNEGAACAASLTAAFAENTLDISSAHDGYRRICADGINFSIKLPADYRQLSSATSGHIAFSGENGRIDIDAAPKTDSAGMLAWNDFSRRLEKINTEKTEFSRITPRTYATIDTFSYTAKTSDNSVRYVFFTSGDTEYRISISGKLDEARELAIMNSIIPATPDKAYPLYALLPPNDRFKIDVNGCSFTFPGAYVPSKNDGYFDRTTGAEIELYYPEEREWSTKKSLAHAQELAKMAVKDGAVITSEPSKTMVAKKDYYAYSAEYPNGLRELVFTSPHNSREVMIRARVSELYDTEAFRAELEGIITSLK